MANSDTDPLYWRLVYADGSSMDEPSENASLRTARPGAIHLLACKGGSREPVNRVDLGDRYIPVWYRKRSISVNFASPGTRPAAGQLDVTVMGRVRDGEHDLDGTVWASFDGLTFRNCPDWCIDRAAIEGLLKG